MARRSALALPLALLAPFSRKHGEHMMFDWHPGKFTAGNHLIEKNKIIFQTSGFM